MGCQNKWSFQPFSSTCAPLFLAPMPPPPRPDSTGRLVEALGVLQRVLQGAPSWGRLALRRLAKGQDLCLRRIRRWAVGNRRGWDVTDGSCSVTDGRRPAVWGLPEGAPALGRGGGVQRVALPAALQGTCRMVRESGRGWSAAESKRGTAVQGLMFADVAVCPPPPNRPELALVFAKSGVIRRSLICPSRILPFPRDAAKQTAINPRPSQ